MNNAALITGSYGGQGDFARERTMEQDLSMIAYLLRYLELNSFLRAFSSWTGISPLEYRRSQL